MSIFFHLQYSGPKLRILSTKPITFQKWVLAPKWIIVQLVTNSALTQIKLSKHVKMRKVCKFICADFWSRCSFPLTISDPLKVGISHTCCCTLNPPRDKLPLQNYKYGFFSVCMALWSRNFLYIQYLTAAIPYKLSARPKNWQIDCQPPLTRSRSCRSSVSPAGGGGGGGRRRRHF